MNVQLHYYVSKVISLTIKYITKDRCVQGYKDFIASVMLMNYEKENRGLCFLIWFIYYKNNQIIYF